MVINRKIILLWQIIKILKYQFPASAITSGDIAAARLNNAPAETKPTVASVSPSTITNDAQNIVITGTNYVAIPRVDVINTATGIWYSVSTVTRDSATQLTVNLTLAVDAGTYRIRVENPDGNSGISAASFLTVSDAPVWTTSAGSLGSCCRRFFRNSCNSSGYRRYCNIMQKQQTY